MFVVGAFHAFILPTMPYGMWLFAMIGWLIFVVEAMMAAPVWAMMHCRMDGQDLVDQVQKPGYMIAFNLFLRPPLMLMGLLMSFGVFTVILYFMDKTFYPFVESMTDGHVVGLIGMVTLLIIITYLHYQVSMRVFSLVHQVPDRVSRWFGQGGENLGEQQDADKMVGAVGGMVGKGEGSAQGAASAAVQASKYKKAVGVNTPSSTEDTAGKGKGGGGNPKP